MTNYRNSKLIERYEDVIFELGTTLVTEVDNNASQKKTGYSFFVDNTGESTPLDWYNARFDVNITLQKKADGGNVANGDEYGIVNGSHALIKRMVVRMNGVGVYDCQEANHATNIKNLLEYSQGYIKSQGTNELYYPDTTTTAVKAENSGFAARKLLLNDGAELNVEIALNRYGFFESLHNELLPNSKIQIEVEIDKDENLAWKSAGADDLRVVLKKFQLIVPRIVFNDDGKSFYMDKYLNTRKWTYLRELVQPSDSTQQKSGSFRISSGINKPRHVFIFFIDDVNDEEYSQNKFLYNTFSVADDKRLESCHLVLGNGNDYPETHLQPETAPSRVFREVLKYVHANNDYAGSTLLNRANFKSIYQFLYFDLTKQPTDIKDGMTRLAFKYTLDNPAGQEYKVYALVLYEQDVELRKVNNRLVLKSE